MGAQTAMVVPEASSKSTNYVGSQEKKVCSSDPMIRPMLYKLDQALTQERKTGIRTQSLDDQNLNNHGSITSGMRDGSAHILRCLKVWYDLPSDIFFNAVSSIDIFLEKMKAQPKHLSCIAVSAFHLACEEYQRCQGTTKIKIPDPADLVTISQSRCSSSDLLRMKSILANKLGINEPDGEPHHLTSLVMLRIMFEVCKATTVRLNLPDLLPEEIPDHLLYQLEILACDSMTMRHRPAEVALALVAADFQRRATSMDEGAVTNTLMGLITELQKYCDIHPDSFVTCLKIVVRQLENYNGEGTVTHRQRLIWKLSNRTLRHLRPTDKLRATLPTIKEATNSNSRHRSSSECSAESMESLSSESDYERDMEIDENQ